MSDERDRGKFKPGHKGFNKPLNPEPEPDPPGDNDFDTAVLAAAANFGRTKPKLGLAGYCASLRDQRPIEFAALVKQASTRKQTTQSSAAAPITVEITPCPANFFMPSDEAFALWAARTGSTPVLVIDNATSIEDADDPDDDPDNAPDTDDPDDENNQR